MGKEKRTDMRVPTPVIAPNQTCPSKKDLAALEAEIQTLNEQLRQAEEQRASLQTAFDTLPAGTVVLAADGMILHANAIWLCFHQTQEILNVGANYLTFCDSSPLLIAEAPSAAEGIRAVIAGRQPEFRLDFPCPTSNQWFTLSVVPFAEPAPRRVVVTHTDSTIHKRAEAAARTQRSYTEALLHSLTALNSSLDVEAIMKQILAAAAMVLPTEAGSIILFEGEVARVAYCRGFSAEAAAFFKNHRFRCNEIIPRGNVAHASAYLIPDTTLWPAWIPLRYTEWIRSSIGVPITIRDKIIGLLVADSTVTNRFQPVDLEKLQAFAHYAGLALENAQHVNQLEARVQERTTELQRATEQAEAILHHNLDSILLVHPNLEVAHVNRAFYRLFACTSDRGVGQSLFNFIHQEDHATLLAALHAVRTKGTGQFCEARANRCDGTAFDAELSLGPLNNNGLICTIRDITERKQAQVALAEEHNLLRTLIDAIPDVIFVKDRDHRVLLRNGAQGVLLPAVPPETVVGKTGKDFFSAADAAATQAEEDRILETGDSILHHERRITRADGSNAWISRTKVPLRNLQGEIIGLAGIIQDVSQRKEHEQQLRFFAALQENVSDAVIATDLEFRIQSWNRAAEAIYGWRAEEVIGRPIKDVLHTQYAVDVTPQEALQMILKQGRITGELLQHRKDGTSIDVFFALTLLKDPQDTPYGLVTLNRDITEQKQAAKALRAQYDLLQQVVDGVPAFILVTDGAGIIQLANQYVAQLVNLTPTQLIGTHAITVGHQMQDLPSFRQRWQQMLTTWEPLQQEEQLRDRSYQVTAIPLKRQQGQHDRLLVVATDITNHKAAEATLNKALQKEKELGELKSRFLSIASHEFRTPLTTILGQTGLLRSLHQRLTSEQITQRLDKIHEQVNHITLIMDDVLLLSQSQRGIFAPIAVDLDALCQTIIDELCSNPANLSRLNYRGCGTAPQILLDQRLLRQVITNLITNALKYSPPEKPVSITLDHQEGNLVLAVSDEGIGIPAADINFLFRPFYRAANVGKLSGTGLGLAIVKDAVERHGGTITVQSVVGVGTTFCVRLPVAN